MFLVHFNILINNNNNSDKAHIHSQKSAQGTNDFLLKIDHITSFGIMPFPLYVMMNFKRNLLILYSSYTLGYFASKFPSPIYFIFCPSNAALTLLMCFIWLQIPSIYSLLGFFKFPLCSCLIKNTGFPLQIQRFCW